MCAYRNLKEVHYKLITRTHKQTHIIHGVLTNRVWDLRGEARDLQVSRPLPSRPNSHGSFEEEKQK
jgi:hypothetical protein